MAKKHLVEAALFMSAEPLTIDQLSKIMETETLGKALGVLDTLVPTFNERDSALEIVKTTDGRYRMQVKGDYLTRVKHLAITTDLPKSALRTLAIIAFKQPIKQSIVVKMRGNKAYDHIAQLVEEGFVKKTREGNTYVLETTKKFIDYFGEPIQNTDFVPKDMQTILGRDAESAEEEIVGEADAAAIVEETEVDDTPTGGPEALDVDQSQRPPEDSPPSPAGAEPTNDTEAEQNEV
ncbi:SMC-Scp complex subunit ScpB [archaeon]